MNDEAPIEIIAGQDLEMIGTKRRSMAFITTLDGNVPKRFEPTKYVRADQVVALRAEVERLRAARDQDIDAAAMRIARAWTKYEQWPELGARCTLDTMAGGGLLRAMARAALEGKG